MNMLLGKTKTNGKVRFLINSRSKKFAIDVEKTDYLNNGACNFWPYDIKDLVSVQVVKDNNIVYENKNNALSMITGGLLFGSVGAVAGSIIANKKQSVKEKNHTH